MKNNENKLGLSLIRDSRNNVLFVNDNIVKFVEKLKYELSIEGEIRTLKKKINKKKEK